MALHRKAILIFGFAAASLLLSQLAFDDRPLSPANFQPAPAIFTPTPTSFQPAPQTNTVVDFTIVVLPDTQYYAGLYPDILKAQVQWVADHRNAENIVYVASLGDNVDDAGARKQWSHVDAAYDLLDEVGVPYGLAAGNHDGAPSGTGNFNKYFGVRRFIRRPTYGGYYGVDNDNSFALFEASGLRFILVFIEYDEGMTVENHPVLVWADSLLRSHNDRRAIVISHNLLEVGPASDFSAQGKAIYNALKGNPKLFLMMGGHLDIAARRSDTYQGKTVYSLRSDYQYQDDLQTGYLRLLRFSPGQNRIDVRTYSPTRDRYYPDATDNNFSLAYDMSTGGNTSVP